jgi:hypothetical protein
MLDAGQPTAAGDQLIYVGRAAVASISTSSPSATIKTLAA